MSKILVLEDDDRMRSMLCQVLQAEGYEVDSAPSGFAAIELAALNPYDLVIADIRMEGVDGLEALARMKEQQPEIRSLVVTGYSTEADSIRAIRLGVGDYLRKPFSFDELMDSVNRLLDERRREQQRKAQETLMRRTLLKAVETAARSLDLAGVPGRPEGGLLEVGKRALRLAQLRGLGPESAEEVQLGAWIVALARSGAEAFFSEDDLPPTLQRALRHVDERWDGSGGPDGLKGEEIPLESRVIAVSLGSEEADPALVQLSRQAQDPVEPGTAAQVRGLLSLGRALEAAGQPKDAAHAYEQMLAGPPGREKVEALVALSRLQGGDYARQAVQLAQQVGPSTAAWVALECGLQQSDPQLLVQAGRLYRELQSPSRQALATMGLATLGQLGANPELVQGAMELLGRAEHREDVQRHRRWLAPWLFSRPVSTPEAARLALRVLPESGLTRVLPSPEQRRNLVEFLGRADTGAPPALAAELQKDPDPEVRTLASRLQSGGERTLPVLRLCTLGPLEVYKGEERVANNAWRSQKAKFILAYLASARRPVSEDVLIDIFWSDDVEKGRRNLYWVSSILRSCLRPTGWGDELDYVLRSQGMLQLNPDLPRWHDLDMLDDFTTRARSASQSGADAADLLRRAVALYRGQYLEGCYMDWAEPIRDRAFRTVCDSLMWLANWAASGERWAEAWEHASRLWELDMCRQDACLVGMQALQAMNRSDEAVRLFERCRKALQRDLEMEPGLPLLEAHQRALLSLSR